MKRFLTILSVTLLGVAVCGGVSAKKKAPFNKKNLVTVFNTGFEADSRMTDIKGGNNDITGIDRSVAAPNDWDSTFVAGRTFYDFKIGYEGGDTTMRYARIVPDPVNPKNHVLKYWLYKPNVKVNYTRGIKNPKARIQADIKSTGAADELYQSVRMYFDPSMEVLKKMPEKINWLTIMEWWNNPPGRGNEYIFRITLGLHKAEKGECPLVFHVDSQNFKYFPLEVTKQKGVSGKFDTKWKYVANDFEIPFGKWMTIEYYIKKGDENSGRFYMTVTPDGGKKQVLFDITGDTYGLNNPNPTGMIGISPMKLYTAGKLVDYVRENGGALQIYWDDLTIMTNKHETK